MSIAGLSLVFALWSVPPKPCLIPLCIPNEVCPVVWL